MAKNKGGPGCSTYIFLICIVAIVGGYILFTNVCNYKIFFSHNPSQYIANIINFHKDSYCTVKVPTKVFKKIMNVSETETATPLILLTPKKRFKFKGYIAKENIMWVAVKIFKSSEVIYGYFMIPEKVGISTFKSALSSDDAINNRYFKEISYNEIKNYRTSLLKVFKRKINEKLKIMKVSGGLNIQKIKESSKYKIIPSLSDDNVAYYCATPDYNTSQALYDIYLGNNFETHYLQTNSKYDFENEGVFKESSFMKFLDTWYCKIGLPLFCIFLFISLLSFMRRNKCPKCKSPNIYEKGRNIIGQKYEHENKNGKRNKRYKDNPLISNIEISMKCKKCSNIWHYKIVKKSDGDKINTLQQSSGATKKVEAEFTEPGMETKQTDITPSNHLEKLKKLKDLFDAELITEEEYKKKKQGILDKFI